MSRPVTIFADNGVRTLHRYVAGRPPRREIDAWAGMCMEAHRGQEVDHVFADGLDLLRSTVIRLSPEATRRARDVLTEPPAPHAQPGTALDALLTELAADPSVVLTWARFDQRVAVGTEDSLLVDQRRACTLEVSSAEDPACNEVVYWDSHDGAGNLDRVHAAIEEVRRFVALPTGALPAVSCDVVFEPGRAGPFFHELVGHPLEADIVASGTTYLGSRLGDQVAPSWLSVSDGPAQPDRGRAGEGLTATVDDEGMPARTVNLITAGRVTGQLSDVATGDDRRNGGHSRRKDYRHPGIPRMWHTVARVQDADPEPAGQIRLAARSVRLRWMNLLTGDFEFALGTAELDSGDGFRRRVGPCVLTGNALTTLAALRPGTERPRGGGRASKGCGKLGQFPLVTTFANSGLWIPGEVVNVRSDSAQ
jgi:TldD protein